jgi:hypothetical protein
MNENDILNKAKEIQHSLRKRYVDPNPSDNREGITFDDTLFPILGDRSNHHDRPYAVYWGRIESTFDAVCSLGWITNNSQLCIALEFQYPPRGHSNDRYHFSCKVFEKLKTRLGTETEYDKGEDTNETPKMVWAIPNPLSKEEIKMKCEHIISVTKSTGV